MFEDYIEDAYDFYLLAEAKSQAGNEREAKMFFRAAVFCAASSLEAFINLIGETFKHGNNLDKNEIAFLNDKVIDISSSKGAIEEKTKYNPIDGKIKFIIKRFKVEIDLSKDTEWANFLKFKDLRDSLIHSKTMNDEKTLSEYKIDLKNGLNANIDIMNKVSLRLFTKPLRRSLSELKIK